MYRFLLTLFFYGLQIPVVMADSVAPLTLDGAIDEALHRSPEIGSKRAVVDEKKARRFESLGSGFLPKVSVTGLHYFDTQYTNTSINFGGSVLSFPGFYPNTQLSLDVSIPLFNGLSNLRDWQAASLVADASERELSRAEFELTENVRLVFYQALAAAELQLVTQQNVRTLEDHLRQVKVQRAGGVATSYDTLRVEVQLNEAHADAIDAEDNAVLTRRKLNQLLGLMSDERQLQGVIPLPDPGRIRNLELNDVPKDRTDIEALNLRAEAADRADSARSAWLIPSVSLTGQYLLYDSQAFNNVVLNTGSYLGAYNIGVLLKWNLFDGGVSLAQAQESASLAVQAEKATELAKLQVPYDLAYWKRRYLSNSDHYLSKKFDVTRSEESVRLAKEEEKAGTRTSTETLDAELDLFRSRAGVVNALVSAIEAQIRLELALGRRI